MGTLPVPKGGYPIPTPACAVAEPVIGSHAPDAITLGRIVDPNRGVAEKIRYSGDQHVLVFGPNGTGKGTRILVPNLLQMAGNRSVVVIDPKGELAAITAPMRRQCGRVVIINPFGVLTDWPGYQDLKSCGFNPLATLDPSSPSFNSQAALLAEAMVEIEPKDPHWTQSARALIAALIMHVVMQARGLGRTPTIARVRELLCAASSEGNERLDMPPVGIPAIAAEMMKSDVAGLKNKAAQFSDWNKEVQSIASTAKIQTEPFDDDEIAADLARDGFDFRDLKREPITVYLILPPEMMDRHSKWLRLVLTAAIQGVLRARRPGEPRTLFVLDEFYALGHLEIIATVWALVRGYGIQMMPILQSLGQLKKLYPEMWETFTGMAGAMVSFAPNDLTTAEWLSRRSGETTRTIRTYNSGTSSGGSSGSSAGPNGGSSSSGSSWGSSSGVTASEIRAPLMTAHKMFGLPPGFGVVTLAGLSHIVPIYAPPYYDIRQCWITARDNPYYQGG